MWRLQYARVYTPSVNNDAAMHSGVIVFFMPKNNARAFMPYA